MFDPMRDSWSSDQLAARIGANQAELRERECETLLLAAAWADAHGIDSSASGYEPLVERPVPGVVTGLRRSRSTPSTSSARCTG